MSVEDNGIMYTCTDLDGQSDQLFIRVSLQEAPNEATTVVSPENEERGVVISANAGIIEVTSTGEKFLSVVSGSTIFLTCSVRNNADTGFEGQAIWQGPSRVLYFNTVPAHGSPKYGISMSNSDTTTEYTLEIQDISVEENGMYSCVQFDSERDQLNIQVSVQDPTTTPSPIITTVGNIEEHGPVYITADGVESDNPLSYTVHKSLTVLLRSTIFLTCIVRNEGTKSEDAVWQGLREDTPSSADKYRFSTSQSGDGSATIHTLEIRDLNEEDEGLYTCKRVSDSSTDKLVVNVLAYSHQSFANNGVEKLKVMAIDNQRDSLLSDVEIGVFSAEPSSQHGTTSLYEQSHFIKTISLEMEAPRNVPVIVTARKSGYLPVSDSITLRTDQANAITLKMTRPTERESFTSRINSSMSHAFEFGDARAGKYLKIKIPPATLKGHDGLIIDKEEAVVHLNCQIVNITEPEELETAPELTARREAQEDSTIPESALVGLNAFGMVYINISAENGDALSFEGDNSPVIEIAVVDNARTKPGRTMPAWRFDKESGVWQPFTFGTFAQSCDFGRVWQFQMPTNIDLSEDLNDMWLAAGDPWEETGCVKVKTCFNKKCSKPASEVPVTFTGENFGYHVSRTTDENGQICIPFMTGGRVRITLPCKDQSRVVQVRQTASTCGSQASAYDFPKSTSTKVTENACEEYTFVVKKSEQQCQYFDRPDWSSLIGADRRHGGTIYFICNPGYELVGSNTIVCTRYKCAGWSWKPQMPKCVPKEQPSPTTQTDSTTQTQTERNAHL